VDGQFQRLAPPEELPELITIADYLNAHLPGFRVEGASQTDGGHFEQAVANALQEAGFEVMIGVRPERVADQIEIDLVIRYKNQVGIAEVKLGGGEAPKKGVDQLSTAGRREYLGTYTRKFLIVARRQNNKIRQLARESDVTLIELPDYRSGRPLSSRERCQLLQIIYRDLAGIRHRC
jgi:predicted RecB family endonuclease